VDVSLDGLTDAVSLINSRVENLSWENPPFDESKKPMEIKPTVAVQKPQLKGI